MTTIILQCGKCRYNVKWIIPDDSDEALYVCDQYPDGIPESIEQGIPYCPKFEKGVKNG